MASALSEEQWSSIVEESIRHIQQGRRWRPVDISELQSAVRKRSTFSKNSPSSNILKPALLALYHSRKMDGPPTPENVRARDDMNVQSPNLNPLPPPVPLQELAPPVDERFSDELSNCTAVSDAHKQMMDIWDTAKDSYIDAGKKLEAKRIELAKAEEEFARARNDLQRVRNEVVGFEIRMQNRQSTT